MRVMVAGDTHGNTNAAVKLIKTAERHGIRKIMQVGDFGGTWLHLENGFAFTDTVNDELRRRGMKMYALGGNHENWEIWNNVLATHAKDQRGFAYLRSHILLAPRIHFWDWDGKTCAIVSGGYSIDKAYRKPGLSWWADEEITDEEIDNIRERKVDYLFTHDASDKTPWRRRLKPDIHSQMHRQRIDRALGKLKPEVHFHGHMHERYEWVNWVNGHYIQTYGLECDGMHYSWGILDTSTERFQWAGIDKADA